MDAKALTDRAVQHSGDDILARDQRTCQFFRGGHYERAVELLEELGLAE